MTSDGSFNTTAEETRSPNVPENLEVQILSPTNLNLTWSQRNNDKAYDICFVELRNALRCEDGHILKRFVRVIVVVLV